MPTDLTTIRNNLPSTFNELNEQMLLDPKYLAHINDLITFAEKEGKNQTAYFNDIDMVYHFIHYSTNIQEIKDRKSETRKQYLREILEFCKVLTTEAENFEISIDDVQKHSSFLKALRPWNIRKFNEWIKTVPNGRNKQPYSVSTLARKLATINSFILHLYKNEYISIPLHEHIKKATVRAEDRPNRDFHFDEAQQLLNHFKEQNNLFGYMITLFLVTTGLRIDEVANANIGDLFKAENKIWLKVIGKRDKLREVYISQHLFECICEYRKRKGLDTNFNRTDHTPLLVSGHMNKFNSNYLSNKVTKLIADTQLPCVLPRENPITAHTFRHGFAIIAAENNVELLRIQQTLGHESPNTTKIYLEKTMKRKHNAALSFADSFS
ncbi:tyrosine-type recombinase/integrase [Bacillus paramycoides]|uniref:Integrase n=1 Tax=Bacillus paramycoides TaxID=2026194 RepID=A0A1J9VUK0_9BACI|nr:site-specific integrase [Bacillus paramycoides]OJD79148.1 integrase [Bacillus paramycoides]